MAFQTWNCAWPLRRREGSKLARGLRAALTVFPYFARRKIEPRPAGAVVPSAAFIRPLLPTHDQRLQLLNLPVRRGSPLAVNRLRLLERQPRLRVLFLLVQRATQRLPGIGRA